MDGEIKYIRRESPPARFFAYPMTLTRRSFLHTLLGAAAVPSLSQGTPSRNDLLKPARLEPGHTVALVCPAGAIFEEADLVEVEQTLTDLGLFAKRGRRILNRYGYLGGSDADRAADVNEAFADSAVDAILAVRGGWGCNRILDRLDFEAITQNPKILMGFSDITSLLIALYARTGLVTFHGPVGISTWSDFTVSNLQPILFFGETPLLQNATTPAAESVLSMQGLVHTIRPGTAQGRLVGGNLTVLTAMLGSPYMPDWTDHILFVEDIDEAPYRVDRMLTQLKIAGVLDQISGFIFGQCTRCDADEDEESLTLTQLFRDHIRPLGIPAWHGSMIGHIRDKFTLPLGVKVEINARRGTIQLLEPAVI